MRELLNLAEKAHALADYWRSQAQDWDNQVKQWHDVVLFCREQRRRIHELRGGEEWNCRKRKQ